MITLIEEKGKDKRDLKNWRPISLINVYAKIASKALAFRIRRVIANLIHSDQMVYVKGRYIGESVCLISDILEYTENKGIDAILFLADFEKAFDLIDHTFLFSVLKSYGFGPDYIQWVKALFNNVESCIMNNGHSTGYFPLKRGTRQGDPLSAYLFIPALEVMLFQERSNEQIEGIKINNFKVKLAALADDTYFFTLDIWSLLAVLDTCKTFQEFFSLKLNLEKCQACWIGAAKDKSDTPISCNWININHHKVVTLGMFNSYNCFLAEKQNFLNQISSVNERLHTWGHRGLTLAGRILIFKSMALTKAVYTSTMVSPLKQFIDLLSSIKQDFIWKGHRLKIKHSALVGEYAEGGYKDVDIQSQLESLKIIWIRRFLDDNFHAWKSILNAFFLDLRVNAVFHDNFKPSTYCMQKNSILSSFLSTTNRLLGESKQKRTSKCS